MIQMLAAVVVCAAMTRFVFLGLTEEGEQGPGSAAPNLPPCTLRQLEGSIELDMAKKVKPDFVVVVKDSETRVELPKDFDPKPKVAFASAKDLIFCRAQTSDERVSTGNRVGHRAAPAPPPASPTSPQEELLRFLSCGHADEHDEGPAPGPRREDDDDEEEDAEDAADGDELDEEVSTNLGRGEPPSKRLEDGTGATVWPAPPPSPEVGKAMERPPNSEPGELCTICFENTANAAVFPCGHVGLCYSCALGIHARGGPCPFCRTKMDQMVTIDRRYPLYNSEGNVLFRVTGPNLEDVGSHKANLEAAAAVSPEPDDDDDDDDDDDETSSETTDGAITNLTDVQPGSPLLDYADVEEFEGRRRSALADHAPTPIST